MTSVGNSPFTSSSKKGFSCADIKSKFRHGFMHPFLDEQLLCGNVELLGPAFCQ